MARVMPVPMMNILNGGAHASNNVDAQEFMVVPIGADNFAGGLRMGVEVFHALKKVLTAMKLSTAVGDEGGFAPMLPSNEAALDVVMQAIEKAGYQPGKDMAIALDVAASRALPGRRVRLQEGRRQQADRRGDGRALHRVGATGTRSCRSRTGWPRTTGTGWALLTEELDERVQLVGDDLFCTNVDLLARGHRGGRRQRHPDQGQPDRHADRDAAVHRAGEGELRTAWSSRIAPARPRTPSSPTWPWRPARGRSRPGSASRTDRVAKYNQLLRIAEELGRSGPLPGPGPLSAVSRGRDRARLVILALAAVFALQGGEYSSWNWWAAAASRAA